MAKVSQSPMRMAGSTIRQLRQVNGEQRSPREMKDLELKNGGRNMFKQYKEERWGTPKFCERLWSGWRSQASALDREDIKTLLDMLLIIFTLILSFSIAHMFTFEPNHLTEADQRTLQYVLNRTVTTAELSSIYEGGDNNVVGSCRWFNKKQNVMFRDSVSRPFGAWDDDICSSLRDRKLPSYALFESSSQSIAQVFACLFVGILFYMVIISCKPLEDEETYTTFIALTFPIIIFIIVVGWMGILEFFFSLEHGAYVLYPRINSGDVFYHYYFFFSLSLMIPGAFFIIVSAFIAWRCHMKSETNILRRFGAEIESAELNLDRMVQYADNPLLLNQLLKDARISKPGCRLEIIHELTKQRERLAHVQPSGTVLGTTTLKPFSSQQLPASTGFSSIVQPSNH
ncbi:hypothetical protein AAMO2058_001070800 [Amorphochlora amoebiformis]